MKKVFVFVLAVLIMGCAYGENFLKDPHYMDYREDLDRLESSYLTGEIGYAQYLREKRALDEEYEKEVKDREEKIHLEQMTNP